MRERLLCAKNVHFTHKGDIYMEVGGVKMGSPLAPPLADFFYGSVGNFVSLRIQFECGKIRTRIIPNTDSLHAAYLFCKNRIYMVYYIIIQ